MITIRDAIKSDLAKLVQIDAQCNPFPWSLAQFMSSLHSDQKLWVVEKAQQVIAYLIWQNSFDEAEIYHFAVDEHHRRQKVGQSLIEKMFEVCREMNIHTIFLEVRLSNLGAQAFYKENNFRQIAVRPNYYNTPTGLEDALIMKAPC